MMTSIDKSLVRKQFSSGLKSYSKQASVQKQMAQMLITELCQHIDKPLRNIFEVGSGTGFLTQGILEFLQPDHLITNDITTTSGQNIRRLETVYNRNIPFIEGDAEEIEFPQRLDAVISGSTIQWFKNIKAFFKKVKSNLEYDGILAVSTFGCHNFREVKSLTGVGLNYLCLYDLIELLSEDFNVLFQKEWTEAKEFTNPVDVLRHMKQTGVNGISKKPFGKKQLNEFTQNYKAIFLNQNEKVTLTYNPIIIVAQKKL
jgi:malonyl-CoA O-methyltransferase/biotin synthesis protein BioG